MAIVQVGDIEVYYEEHGAGEPLLLIMGWGGNAAAWKPQIPGLAEKYRVIAFDNRGVGRSSAPDKAYSIQQMAMDAAGLLDVLEVPSAHVFGISMGGMIAQELALAHPKRVRSLILGCTTPGSKQSAGYAQLRKDIAAFHRKTKGAVDLEWFADFLNRLWTDEALTKADGYLQDFVFAMIRFPPDPRGVRHQARAIARHDTYDRLHQIKQRTLVMTGDDDTLIDSRNATILTDLIPNAELRVFPGLRHAFHLERPDLVNEVMIEFIERERPSRRKRTAGRARVARRPS